MWEEATPCPPPGHSAEDDQRRISAAEEMVTMGQTYMAERIQVDAAPVGHRPHGGS